MTCSAITAGAGAVPAPAAVASRCSALRSAPRAASRRASRSSSATAASASPASTNSSAARGSSSGPARSASTRATRPASAARSGGSSTASTASRVSACGQRSAGPSVTSSACPTAARRARSTSCSEVPAADPSRRQSSSGPSTAAVCRIAWAGSGSAASRSATSAASVGGTAEPGAATSSSTAKGNPSERSSRRSASASVTGRPPRHAAANAATSRPFSRPRCRVIVPGAAARRRAAWAGASSRRGAGQQDGRVGGGTREVLDQGERVVVGPVQVLQAQHAAGRVAQREAQQPEQALGEDDDGVRAQRRADPAVRFRPAGQQPGERGAIGAQLGVPGPGRVVEEADHRARDRPERPPALHRPAGQHGQPALRGPPGHLVEQAGLPDPGLPGDEQRATPPGGDGVDQPAGGRELGAAADQDGAAGHPAGTGRTGDGVHALSTPVPVGARKCADRLRRDSPVCATARRSAQSARARATRRVAPGRAGRCLRSARG